MTRRLSVLTALAALLCLCAGTARAADEKKKVDDSEKYKGKLVIRWHGQSFFEIISSKGTRIVLDPHAIEEFGKKSVKADLVLMSHLHDDHTMVGVVSNIKEAKQYNGLKVVDKRQEWNILDEKFKDVHFYTVGTFHDSFFGMKRGRNSIIVIEVDGLRIAHLGDLGHTLNDAQIKKVNKDGKKIDILMIPIGGTYTINGLDAQKVVEQLEPKRYILPMHYGMDKESPLLTLEFTGFLDDVDKGKIKKLRDTNVLVIDPKEATPKDWSIILLGYEEKKTGDEK
jgi:L-ascorbate metabolism protein UlaG (beta-lactamase superfamily)